MECGARNGGGLGLARFSPFVRWVAICTQMAFYGPQTADRRYRKWPFIDIHGSRDLEVTGSKAAAFAFIPSTNSGPLEHLRAEVLLSVQINGGLKNI